MDFLRNWFLPARVVALLLQSQIASAAAFDIIELPVGRNVTLLKPATTVVPIATRTTLGPTDLPQILKFESISTGTETAAPIKMAIFDSTRERVRYVNIQPGIPFLYSFTDLDSVLIIPEASEGSGKLPQYGSTKLQIESDKPLLVGR